MGKGLFGGIKEAEINRGGVYILPGIFDLEIESCRAITSRKKDDLFITDVKILTSTNPNRPAGTRMSWMANLTKHEAAMGNIKGFLAAAANIAEEDVDEEGAEAAVSEENPLAGMKVHCEAVEITTKAGKPFTKCMWSPVEE